MSKKEASVSSVGATGSARGGDSYHLVGYLDWEIKEAKRHLAATVERGKKDKRDKSPYMEGLREGYVIALENTQKEIKKRAEGGTKTVAKSDAGRVSEQGLAAAAKGAAERLLNEDEWPDQSIGHYTDIIEAACSLCVVSFANAILHGDEVHRLWLLEAANAFVQGEPMPPPRAAVPIPKPSTEGGTETLTNENSAFR